MVSSSLASQMVSEVWNGPHPRVCGCKMCDDPGADGIWGSILRETDVTELGTYLASLTQLSFSSEVGVKIPDFGKAVILILYQKVGI